MAAPGTATPEVSQRAEQAELERQLEQERMQRQELERQLGEERAQREALEQEQQDQEPHTEEKTEEAEADEHSRVMLAIRMRREAEEQHAYDPKQDFMFLDPTFDAEIYAPQFRRGSCREALVRALIYWRDRHHGFQVTVKPVPLYWEPTAGQIQLSRVSSIRRSNVAGEAERFHSGGYRLRVIECDWRVLAHEIGHALGYEHTSGFDIDNIMHPQVEFIRAR